MTNQKTNWRKLCISVLRNGPKDQSEFETAAALISDGYAAGNFQKSYRGDGGRIANVIWDGPTLKGLEYADEMQEKLDRASLAYKAKMILWNSLSFTSGCLVTTAVQSMF